mmetsp:Transcript_6373/g.10085  ORF Transcript_6373/g.10085 Transcript_6373/m.10085 type:complete len:131 (+) Transcript_6373:53-445(+)
MSSTPEGSAMSVEASKFVLIKDAAQAVLDVIEQILREISVKFIALCIELVNYKQQKEFDSQRLAALLAILYIISFIDWDFIPVIGKIDDLVVMYYAFQYCCNQKQEKLARTIYEEYRTYFNIAVATWLLY